MESSSLSLAETEDGFQPVFFEPRPLKNLLLIDETSSLMPITDMKVANLLKEEIPQVWGGRGGGAVEGRGGGAVGGRGVLEGWGRHRGRGGKEGRGLHPTSSFTAFSSHPSPLLALQIYATCGRGPRSTLAALRPGLAVTELAISPLPGLPIAVWTIRRSVTDEFDQYIIVSFTNATLVRDAGGRG